MDINELKSWHIAKMKDARTRAAAARRHAGDRRASPVTRDIYKSDIWINDQDALFHEKAADFLAALDRQHSITHGGGK